MIINPVPYLTTAHSGPLFAIESVIVKNITVIEAWFRDAWVNTPAPLMSSVDLRNAGFKLAPVDTNLFPAGFNNLNPDFMTLCVQAMQSALGRTCRRILLLPERHTRNDFYLQSLRILRDILIRAGYEVRLGHCDPEQTTLQIRLSDGDVLDIEPVLRDGARLVLADYNPCLIMLNNDLSSGIPEILHNLEQCIAPSPQLGWSTRLKSVHFSHYNDVVREFAQLIDIDPWWINPLFAAIDGIDFMAKTGIDPLARAVDDMLATIQTMYERYHITAKPYVVVKADNGTYGMGVMMVQDAEQIVALNRKQRSKMAKSKGNQRVRRVMIQEGIYSFETMADGAVAEPVVYMIGQFVVGGFYRVHRELGTDGILNTPGMYFEPLAFAQPCNMPNLAGKAIDYPNRFYVYGVIARLAALAAARESAALGSTSCN